MQSFRYDLICVGSGPAGQRAAVQAAKIGKSVAVVEKQRCVGGVCIETGTIPSKTFREAVRGFSSRNPDGTGRARPTMPQLLERVGSVIRRESDVVHDQLARNGVDLIRGHAAFVEPHAIRVESSEGARVLVGDYILIAVGTRPAEPTSVTPDGCTVILSDNILDLEKL